MDLWESGVSIYITQITLHNIQVVLVFKQKSWNTKDSAKKERKTQWETKANMSNPARLRQRADEKVSRFKEKVDNSEKNARNGKKIMRIKKWSIVPGPIHQFIRLLF